MSAESLPMALIDRIFGRFSDYYGAKFLDQWRDHPDQARMKNTWAEKLGGFSTNLNAIKDALDALDDHPFPPTLPEFLTLCRNAARRTGTEQLKLSHRQTPEEREKARKAGDMALSAMRGMTEKDTLMWARRPKSKLAFQSVLDLIQKGDQRFSEILAELQRDGRAEGNCLLNRWDGQQWVKA